MDEINAIESESDADSDIATYFLEPTSCSTTIAERIAEANRELFDASSADDPKSPKVKFSEDLVDFAPEGSESSAEDEALKVSEEGTSEEKCEVTDDVKGDEEGFKGTKLLLVLLPREQSSSSESLTAEDPPEHSLIVKEVKPLTKSRPKSAHKRSDKIPCKLVPVSPELNCLPGPADNGKWHEPQKLKAKEVEKMLPVSRPKTAPSKRQCCIVRDDLPKYNGLRSEYGLSAEQLQERKMKSAEIRKQIRVEKQKQLLESQQKQQKNEEKFNSWLGGKTIRENTSVRKKKDTLVRSDVYIQKHAVYASKCVAYAVNYTRGKSKNGRKTLNLGKLFESISPNTEKTYRIYLEPEK